MDISETSDREQKPEARSQKSEVNESELSAI
jgi:hypothetical protein